MNNKFKNWVLDVTLFPVYSFREIYNENEVNLKRCIRSAKAPGNLVGVVHRAGQDEAEEWVEQNPEWHEQFCWSPDAALKKG